MATVSYTQHTTPRKPDAARVLQSYWHIVSTQGRRGALRKAGELYNVSDETVRRYLAAYDAAHNATETPVELQYVPPPGGYSEPIVPFVVADSVTADAETATEQPRECHFDELDISLDDNATDAAQPQEMALDADECHAATLTQCHADELEPAVLDDTPPMPQQAVMPGRVHVLQLVDIVTFCYEHAPLVQLAVCVVVVAFLVAFVGA
jgi:hypothetical protein